MSALVLLLLAADPATFSDPLYATCPEAPPTEKVVEAGKAPRPLVVGDVLASAARSARIACLMDTCDVDRMSKAKLLDGPQGPKWWLSLGSAFSFGLTVGAALLVGLEKLGLLKP